MVDVLIRMDAVDVEKLRKLATDTRVPAGVLAGILVATECTILLSEHGAVERAELAAVWAQGVER